MHYLSGREVVLVKSFIDDTDYMIVELIRFDEDGKKRVVFFEDKVKLLNGDTWDVIYRASTYAGVERYISQKQEYFKDKKLAILPINTDEDFENSSMSKSYSELCSNIFNAKDDPFLCIHCGDPVSDDQAPLIELDENGRDQDVGLAHANCTTPIDRILGVIDAEIFRENSHLKNFDYKSWYSYIQKGQGLTGSLSSLPKKVYPIAWKPDYNNISKGMYCVKINLEDGSSRYVTDRTQIVRETEQGAVAVSTELNTSFDKARENNDPWCFTSKKNMFITYSAALQNKDDDEECILCTNAEPVRFTNAINKAYSLFENAYTPLILFLDKNSGLPIDMGGAIFMISTPLSVENYVKNWKRASFELPDYSISIIKSDAEFDKLIQIFKSDGLAVVIDPELDMNGNMTSGFIVENINDLAAKTGQSLTS
jgi:hypothetical protein